MSSTLERLTFRGSQPTGALQAETIRLHSERYRFAAGHVAGARVLDLACGTGYGAPIIHAAGAHSVIGVDIAREAIDEANELHARAGIQFFAADYHHLEMDDIDSGLRRAFREGFDAIVSLETIEHLPDPDDFVRTVLTGLRSGGLFIGSVPVTPSMDANPYHRHDFSSASFRRLYARHGLRVVDSFRQIQRFNPVSVRREMRRNLRDGLRQNLAAYYSTHPSKLCLRAWSTLRFGFVNLIDVLVAQKP